MRIDNKIEEIEGYLSELKGFAPHDFTEYQKDCKAKAACERYFEKIIEAAVDLAFLVIKENDLSPPEEDKGSFDILSREGIITAGLAGRLKDAKGMRNIIAHEYGVVDDEVVFHSITDELEVDIEEFLDSVKQTIQ